MQDHVISVYTYGKHVVQDSQTHSAVSALKIGGIVIPEVLLELFGKLARDVSPKRASYSYIYLENIPTLDNGWLYIAISELELELVEHICRKHLSANICLWRDGKWFGFPTKGINDYQEPEKIYTKPKGSPLGYRTLTTGGERIRAGTTADGEPDENDTGIKAEYSKIYPDKPAWWWLTGNTYPIKDKIKSLGGRWGMKRRCWYYIGDRLPKGILELISNRAETEAIMNGTPPEQAKALSSQSPKENGSRTADEDIRLRRIPEQTSQNVLDFSKEYVMLALDIMGKTIANWEKYGDVQIITGASQIKAACHSWVDTDTGKEECYWYLIDAPNDQEFNLKLRTQTKAKYSHSTFRWEFRDEKEVAAFNHMLLLYKYLDHMPKHDNGLALMPGWLIKMIETNRSENNERDPAESIVYTHLFTPDADWQLWVTNYDEKEHRIYCYNILNGNTVGGVWEWQPVSGLEAYRGNRQLPIERELHFVPKPLSKAIQDWLKKCENVETQSTPEPRIEEDSQLRESDAPCSVGEAAQILGVQVLNHSPAQPESVAPKRMFEMEQTVYARYELETDKGEKVATGTPGKIVKLYQYNKNFGLFKGHSYDVQFEGCAAPAWFFEDELDASEPLKGFKRTKGAFIPGVAPNEMLTDSDHRRQIIDSGGKPLAVEIETITDHTEDNSVAEPTTAAADQTNTDDTGSELPSSPSQETAEPSLEEEAKSNIKIIKPTGLPPDGEPLDNIQIAILNAKNNPPAGTSSSIEPKPFQRHSPRTKIKRNAIAIPQTHVGSITGNVSANVHCYGYAVDRGVCVYLNMGGPRNGVEAIRAKLGMGEPVNVVTWEGPSVELTAGKDNTGKYADFQVNMSEARFVSCILVHEHLTHPNYGGLSTTYIIQTSEEQAKAKLLHHVRELVGVPVFDNWSDYLWTGGMTAMLVKKTQTAGGIQILTVELDEKSWTRLIAGGVEQKLIQIPDQNLPIKPSINVA